jgi:hypothetical protein
MNSSPHAHEDEPRPEPPVRDTVQLRLLTGPTERPAWRLDERTRRVGRQGIAEAREILRRARPPEPKTLAS